MAFTLWSLFEATLLCLNAVCILNEERVLGKVGWPDPRRVHTLGQPSYKDQAINLIRSIRTVTRIPLIFFNVLTIVFKLILG